MRTQPHPGIVQGGAKFSLKSLDQVALHLDKRDDQVGNLFQLKGGALNAG